MSFRVDAGINSVHLMLLILHIINIFVNIPESLLLLDGTVGGVAGRFILI